MCLSLRSIGYHCKTGACTSPRATGSCACGAGSCACGAGSRIRGGGSADGGIPQGNKECTQNMYIYDFGYFSTTFKYFEICCFCLKTNERWFKKKLKFRYDPTLSALKNRNGTPTKSVMKHFWLSSELDDAAMTRTHSWGDLPADGRLTYLQGNCDRFVVCYIY